MRILILWTHLSGYMRACFDCLGDTPDVDLHIVSMPIQSYGDGAFDPPEVIPTSATNYLLDANLDIEVLHDRLAPQVLVVCGWHVTSYRRVARRSRAMRVMTMDNQWLGTPRQRFGAAISRWYVKPAYDFAMVPGDRQAIFAEKLGFDHDGIWRGSYSGSTRAFSTPRAGVPPCEPRFLFAGRLVPAKGVDILVEAYEVYRSRVQDPWSLMVCGTGPLADLVGAAQGVQHVGFVQPSALPTIFQGSSAFVLPSRFEPWGVVIHEACAAGLPVICSAACGAVPALVEDGWNGLIIQPGSAGSLARAFERLHLMDAASRQEMGRRSATAADRYSPQRWAELLVARLEWESDAATRRR